MAEENKEYVVLKDSEGEEVKVHPDYIEEYERRKKRLEEKLSYCQEELKVSFLDWLFRTYMHCKACGYPTRKPKDWDRDTIICEDCCLDLSFQSIAEDYEKSNSHNWEEVQPVYKDSQLGLGQGWNTSEKEVKH